MKRIGCMILFLLFWPMLARGQTTALYYSATVTASGTTPTLSIPAGVDAINVRINGIATANTWSAQIQTSPDSVTWSNCGTAVSSSAGASSSGGACVPSGAAYVRLSITAGAGGGVLTYALMGTCSLCQIASGGGSPGGTTGAAQYNSAGAFAGLNGTGLEYLNGASAPTIATSAQVQSLLSGIYCTLTGCTMASPSSLLLSVQAAGTPCSIGWQYFSGRSGCFDMPTSTAQINANFTYGTITPVEIGSGFGLAVKNTLYILFATTAYDGNTAGTPTGSFFNPIAGKVDCNVAASDTADCTLTLGILAGGGTAATITGTGGTPVCLSGYTCLDARGAVSSPASTTVTTVTFGKTYATAPVCGVTENVNPAVGFTKTTSTTALTITTSALGGTTEFDYWCMQ